MEYFDKYVSDTYAGSSNQLFFNSDGKKTDTGRLFYKVSVGGKHNYSFLFTNIIDSTFANGEISHKNLICDEWDITGMRVGISKDRRLDNVVTYGNYNEKSVTMGESDSDINVGVFTDITFCGNKTKKVMPGEFFTTDPVEIEIEKDDYICIEISFKGKMIPYHEESIISAFIKNDNRWTGSKYMPFPAMIGCDRKVDLKVGYIGDSITQGCGTEVNSYAHWNAVVSELLGDNNSYWNLGIGYGRANDAAADGSWLFKAKQCDAVCVCFGVNDILRGLEPEQTKKDLEAIVDNLHEAGKKVLIQTIPPFDYKDENILKWKSVNQFIRNVLKEKTEGFFDCVPVLCDDGKDSPNAKFGGHPNAEGCEQWAKALYPEMKRFLEIVKNERKIK